MPVAVSIRAYANGAVHEITLDELKEEILTGRLGPAALIRDRYWTGNDWWTLDNLRLFHKLSPNHHPPGSHLAKKLRAEEAKESRERATREWQAEVSASLPVDFLEQCFGTKKINVLLAERGCVGISRLIEKPSFGPPGLITLTFGVGCVQAEVLTATESPYAQVYSVFQAPCQPIPDWREVASAFASSFVNSWKAEIGRSKLPEVFHSWESFVEAGRIAGECCTPTLDGTAFTHEFVGPNAGDSAEWWNPTEEQHPTQAMLLEAYRSLMPDPLDSAFKGRQT